VFQIVIVATSEEIIFRGALLRYFMVFGWIPAYVVSSVLFGLFHYAAYGGNISSIIIAIFIGWILALLAHKWNLGAAIGFHAAYNGFVLGATTLG